MTYQQQLKAAVVAFFCGFAFQASAELIWSDEFDTNGAPDATVWSYDLGAGGWGNSELQEYTSDSSNVRIDNGVLLIQAREVRTRGKRTKYTSARIKTENKLTIKYGTIEARIQMPDIADGLWPAFWTLGNNFSSVGWPACGELDIVEMGSSGAIQDGVVRRRISSTAHWEHSGSHASYGLAYDADVDLNNDFHIYRMDWTPDTVTTYIDGNWVWTMDISPDSCTDCTEFHEPHFLILNLAVGGTFPGLFRSSDITAPTPATYAVDYVRIYANEFSQLGGSSIDGGGGDDGGGGGDDVDADGDGYTVAEGDCNDADATINPGARDRGGKKWADGIDNDCNNIVDG